MNALVRSFEDPAFTIEIDIARQLVVLTLRGLWSLDTCACFDRRLRTMLRALPLSGCPIGSQLTLFDLLDFPVQQQATLTALGAMAADEGIGSRRIAILTHSQLVRQQARRVAPSYGLFGDRPTAMTWLLHDQAVTA